MHQAITMRTIPVFLLFLTLSFCIYGQNNQQLSTPADTVLLNNGRVIATHIIDTLGSTITVEKPNSKKHKKIEIDKEDVFSLRYGSTGKEVVIYIYDTLTDHDFTVDEARLFIAGERDAQQGFHALGSTIGGFAIGAATGLAGGTNDFFLVFLPSLIYTGVLSYPRVHINHKVVSNQEYVTHDPYLWGYDNTARRKRTLRALIWGGIGVVVGATLNAIFVKPQ